MTHHPAQNIARLTIETLAAAFLAASMTGAAFAQASPGRGGPDNPGGEAPPPTACIAAPCNPPTRLPKVKDQRQCACDLRRVETRNGVVMVRDCYSQVDGRTQYCETRY